MAEKKPKKPKHTHLVVPGEGGKKKPELEKDRLGREIPPEAAAPAAGQMPPAAKEPEAGPAMAAEKPQPPLPNELPDVAGEMPDGWMPDAPQPEDAAADGEKKEQKGKRKKRRGDLYKNLPAPDKPKKQAPAKPQAAKNTQPLPPAAKPGAEPKEAEEKQASNAVPMPKPKRRMSAGRRRRLKRRIQALVLLLLVVAGILFFTTGAYIATATWVSDGYESLRLGLSPGDGFPMEFIMNGYIKAEPLADNGFAALGERDAVLVSSSGQLRRVTHSYLQPGLSAGNTRAVIYSRGGSEFTVESRTETLARHSTDQDILFCTLSPGGWLAVVTNSRYRATLSVYGPSYDMGDVVFQMPVTDDKPVLAAFAGDNRSLVLGCWGNRYGTQGSTLYLLRTDRDSVQAEIQVDNARLLRAEYLSSGRVLAIFDGFAALYNTKGEQLARYDYNGRRLVTADVRDGKTALVFGTTTGERVQTVLLNAGLEALFEATADVERTPQVLVAPDGVLLLGGWWVQAYSNDGTLQRSQTLDAMPYTLVWAGQPLALTAGVAQPLESLFHPQEEASSVPSGSAAGSAGGGASFSLPASLPNASGASGTADGSSATDNSEDSSSQNS